MPADNDTPPPASPDEPVRLPLLARARGFKTPLAFRRWCRRFGVPIHKTGRAEWVVPADVNRAVLAGPPKPPPLPPPAPPPAEVHSIVDAMKRKAG